MQSTLAREAGVRRPWAAGALAWRPDPARWPVLVVAALLALLTLPPAALLVLTALQPQRRGQGTDLTLANFERILGTAGALDLLGNTLVFGLGSALVAVVLGVTAAWLVERTDAPLRSFTAIAVYVSLAIPVLIKGIGWILLLGPRAGLVNVWASQVPGLPRPLFDVFSMAGLVLVEGVLWIPVVFLMVSAPLRSMDPALEEAAATSGGNGWQAFRRVTLPLLAPAVLAVLLLTFVRSLESFDVPLLLGTPGRIRLFTTEIFQTVNSGFTPRYGEASAYAVLLMVLVLMALLPYYRATAAARRFATVTGRGYRPRRVHLGRARPLAGLVLFAIPLLLVAPVLVLAWASLLPFYAAPSAESFSALSLDNYRRVIQHPSVLSGIRNSLIVGVASATTVAALAATAAWLVVRGRGSARWVVDLLASAPLVFPGIVLGIAVLQIFLRLPLPIYGTVWVLVYALVVRFMPYGIRYAYSGVLAIHEELEESARVNGASTAVVLRRIVLPLIWPAVAATWIYVLLLAVRDLSISVLLAGPESQVISVVILDLWQNGQITEVGAFSILLTAALVGVALAFRRGGERFGFQP